MSRTLYFTTVTSDGLAYDIDFPLHPATRSADGVSNLLTALLDSLSRHFEQHRDDLSDGDLLQALAMLLAIRARLTHHDSDTTEELVVGLFRAAHAAARSASGYALGRA